MKKIIAIIILSTVIILSVKLNEAKETGVNNATAYASRHAQIEEIFAE